MILGYFINGCQFYFCSEFICFELFFIVENFFKYIDWGNMVDIVGFFRQRDIFFYIFFFGKFFDFCCIQGKFIDLQFVQIYFFDDEYEIVVVGFGGVFGCGENIVSGVEFYWWNDNYRWVSYVLVYLVQ